MIALALLSVWMALPSLADDVLDALIARADVVSVVTEVTPYLLDGKPPEDGSRPIYRTTITLTDGTLIVGAVESTPEASATEEASIRYAADLYYNQVAELEAGGGI